MKDDKPQHKPSITHLYRKIIMKYDLIQETLTSLSDMPHITFSAVISIDGLTIASAPQDHAEEERIGALSASFITLSNRWAGEVLQGNSSDYLIINSDNGYMLLFYNNDSLLLTILTDQNAKLNHVLFEAQRALKELSSHFEA